MMHNCRYCMTILLTLNPYCCDFSHFFSFCADHEKNVFLFFIVWDVVIFTLLFFLSAKNSVWRTFSRCFTVTMSTQLKKTVDSVWHLLVT